MCHGAAESGHHAITKIRHSQINKCFLKVIKNKNSKVGDWTRVGHQGRISVEVWGEWVSDMRLGSQVGV